MTGDSEKGQSLDGITLNAKQVCKQQRPGDGKDENACTGQTHR